MINYKPKVSIIVPVYNVKTFLTRCMDSLISQTLKDIEIIAINDGSTDGSLDILNKYSSMDYRIKVIDKINEGLSETRNKGIHIAGGEYISFVDSDDWISKDMLYKMYNIGVENNCDAVLCSYIREYEGNSIPKIFNEPEVTVYDKLGVQKNLYRKLVGPIGMEMKNPENLHSLITAWGKLYKTSILKQNNIKFIDTAIIGTEDCLFNVHAFKYVNKAVFLNQPLYHYWKGNTNSLTTGYKPRLRKQWELMYSYIKKSLDNSKVEKVFYDALNNRICLSTLGLGLNECSRANRTSIIKKIHNIKLMLSEEYIIKAFERFELKHLPIHWRIFYFFNKHRVALPSYLMLRTIELMRSRA